MIKQHNLKILLEHFNPVYEGVKTAELRKNDRDYKIGDTLNLCEWDGVNFTGRFVKREIIHIADVSSYLEGFVFLSMKQSPPSDYLMW